MLHTWVNSARQEARADFDRTLTKYPSAPIGRAANNPEMAMAQRLHGVLKVSTWDADVSQEQRADAALKLVSHYVDLAVKRLGDSEHLTPLHVEAITRGTLTALREIAEANPSLYRVEVDGLTRELAPELTPEQPQVEVEAVRTPALVSWDF